MGSLDGRSEKTVKSIKHPEVSSTDKMGQVAHSRKSTTHWRVRGWGGGGGGGGHSS